MAESEFKVEKDIEMPRATHGRRLLYPWHDMEIGDSFFIPRPDGVSQNKIQHRVGGAIAWQKRSMGTRFATRHATENGVEGIRVWRLE